MSRAHEDLGRPDEDGQGPARTHRGISHNVEVGGSTDGPVVAGDYNLVIDARHGSSVTVGRVARERPAPVRRDRISVLPRPTREPLGREADTATLAAAIAGRGLVQLCGPAGIGKSILLRHLARTAENGPDGVVFVSATHKQVADLAQEVFESCYRTWGYAPSRTDLRGMLTGLRITVYVDDADLTIDELRELTDLVPDATFVVACRDSTLLGDGAVHHLDGLGQDTATRLLTQTLGRPLHDAEQVTAADLWHVSGGNPLLLVRAAGMAASGRSALPAPGAVEDLLPQLFEQLDNSAMDTLNLLAALQDAELATEHIGALASEPDPASLCERLTGLGLMVPGEHGYRCAPGVASAVRHRDPAAIPVEGLCRYFTRWAADPSTTPAQVAAHSRAIEKVAGLATNAGMPELTVALGRAASPKLAHSLRFNAWGRTLGRGWAGARRAGDRLAEAYFIHEEGIRCLVTGQRIAAAALLAQAAVLWHVLGDDQGTTAASDAHQFLPQELQPPGRIDAPAQAVPDEGATSQAVADHMADLEHTTREPSALTTHDSADPGYSSTDFAELAESGVPPGPGPAQSLGNTTAPDAGDPGLTANTTSPALPGSATGATAAATAQGGSLLATLLVTLAIVGAVALIAYDKNKDEEATSRRPTATAGVGRTGVAKAEKPKITSARQTGIAGTWTDGRHKLTIVESEPGVYLYRTVCGDAVRLIGNDAEATGKTPARTSDSGGGYCGSMIGYLTVTVRVSAAQDIARLTMTQPPDVAGRWTCLSCGRSTLTRVG
ncbi:hypothetical protein SAMN05216188_10461 [Lentzea xinjiangensis]|uniref:AAA+ ATPase domain-containing protein n=1 Tax=Lentzea xinjiangensis TaxID=402600 RepID=A0A1H9HIW2_9PSEU|nr:ATP-binding protein [Lentzea xinjiangensis]SEQ62280.1 hypothetical protein SAMN05216188_10461 [Lentzea xinjiangensis]